MGGSGSGRRLGTSRVEDHRVLDISRMHRSGCLQGMRSGEWQWSHKEQVTGSIQYRHDADTLHLIYRFRIVGHEWQQVNEPVRIDWSPCRFGGKRPYFICPGIRNNIACQRKVQKLYGVSSYFLCRHCYGLTYASQSEDQFDRALRKADRLRRKLDSNACGLDTMPRKPKGMWRRTYEKSRDRILELDWLAQIKFELLVAKMSRQDSKT